MGVSFLYSPAVSLRIRKIFLRTSWGVKTEALQSQTQKNEEMPIYSGCLAVTSFRFKCKVVQMKKACNV